LISGWVSPQVQADQQIVLGDSQYLCDRIAGKPTAEKILAVRFVFQA
jgi:hypothetical protein